MEALSKQQQKILDELVSKRQFESGPHPERYGSRLFRKRAKRFRNERMRRIKPQNPSSVIPTHGRYATDRWQTSSITPLERIQDMKLYDAIEEIFRANRLLEETEPTTPTTIEFIRYGWKSFYVPGGLRIPVTPKCRLVPLGYFTVKEKEIQAKLDAKAKAKVRPPFFSRKHFLWLIKFCTYWLREFLHITSRSGPTTFTRVSDFNEHDRIDVSRKNYQYSHVLGPPPYRKRKVPTLYDDCTNAMLAKFINLRKYGQHFAARYRYKATYAIDQKFFRLWEFKDIEVARKAFLQYDPLLTGFVSFEDMCKILDKLGNETVMDVRKEEFDAFVNYDLQTRLIPHGQIEFEEFLRVYYILTYKQVGPNRGYPLERRLTPIAIEPWVTKMKLGSSVQDIRNFPQSFRNGAQCPAISATNSVYWNISAGLF